MLVIYEFLAVMCMFMCPKKNEGSLIQKQRSSYFLVMVNKRDIASIIFSRDVHPVVEVTGTSVNRAGFSKHFNKISKLLQLYAYYMSTPSLENQESWLLESMQLLLRTLREVKK